MRPKKSPAQGEAERLRRENEQLKRELARNKAALEVLGKVPMSALRVATVAG